ncbi:MAG: hypothetical protein D6675_05045 [Gemmatimonadetes bacterium]|nr:MAG: hypothetical protein D6675_05045 [Gemmatimonadota bacterium]
MNYEQYRWLIRYCQPVKKGLTLPEMSYIVRKVTSLNKSISKMNQTRMNWVGALLLVVLVGGSIAAEAPQRIISLAPNITEILFALEIEDRVVGVTDYCIYPPKAAQKASIGDLFNPNIEQIFALQPDLVIGLPASTPLLNTLELQGIPVLTVHNETIADILASIERIGDKTATSTRATALIDSIRHHIEPHSPTPSTPISAMIIIGRDPGQLTGIYVAGGKTFLSELLVRAGGQNAFADIKGYYNEASLEAIIQRNPRVIIELRPAAEQPQEAELRANWQPLAPQLQAVPQHLVFIFGDYLLIPGPRLPQIYHALLQALAPVSNE